MRFGVPEELLSDNDQAFEGNLFKAVCSLMGTKKIHGMSYHSQTQGNVERINGTLNGIIAKYVKKEQDDWDEQIHMGTFAYRNQVHASTGHTPYYMMYGRDPYIPVDHELQPRKRPTCQEKYLTDLRDTLKQVWKAAREASEKQAEYDKGNKDRRARPQQIKTGDLVLLRWKQMKPGRSRKLAPKFRGPYRVLEVNWPNVRVERVGNCPGRAFDYHMNSVKKYVLPLPDDERAKEDEIWFCPKCDGRWDEDPDGITWIGCDACDEWYHLKCAGLKKIPAEEDPWFCPPCVRAQQEAEREAQLNEKWIEQQEAKRRKKVAHLERKMAMAKPVEAGKYYSEELVETEEYFSQGSRTTNLINDGVGVVVTFNF